MITNYGRKEMLKFLSGQSAEYGAAIALGVGTTAATANDEKLAVETLRGRISLRSPDFVAGTVIVRATLGADVAGIFYEAALVNRGEQQVSPVLYGNFDEVWTNGTLDTTNARIGASAVRLNANASGNTTATIDRQFAVEDRRIMLNYFVGSNVSSAYVRLRTDAANYYHYALPVTAGYRSVEVPLSSFTPTGTPDKNNIMSVVVYLASTSGGASQLHFDALMLASPTQGGDVILRQVLAAPVVKLSGIEMDIEMPVSIAI